MNALVAVAMAAAGLPPICTDRPAKANAVCTVPAGMLQIESSLAGWSLSKVQAGRTTVLTIAGTTAKLGLTGRSDLQVSVVPYAKVRTTGKGSVSGIGDVVIRYKQQLNSDDAAVQLAAIPFLKVPTAPRTFGNGKVEGGLAVPVSFALSGAVTMTLGPEADLLADGDERGRHIAIVNLVNVGGPIAPRVTLAGELWSNINLDPARTVKQVSADAALAYAASTNFQIDGGLNRGLTRDTPDWELYGGISVRL